MEEKDKMLKEALDKLEKCCPGSTSVSHMSTASAVLHKALLELDLARSQEQHFREEADALLEGISIIMSSETIGVAFKKILDILKRLTKSDDAFILQENDDLSFSVAASSSPQFEGMTWQHDQMTTYVLKEGVTIKAVYVEYGAIIVSGISEKNLSGAQSSIESLLPLELTLKGPSDKGIPDVESIIIISASVTG